MIRRCAEAGLPEPEFEVGAGLLIRIWQSGDRETRLATETARKQPEAKANSQKTTRKQPENSQKAGGSEVQSPETPSLPHLILALLRQHPSARSPPHSALVDPDPTPGTQPPELPMSTAGEHELTAIVERDRSGYVALCPEVDVTSQGDSVAEARSNLEEALALFFETASTEEIEKRLRTP